MEKIQFNPSGEPLLVNLIFEGLLEVGYTFNLSEAGSNDIILTLNGDNLNDEDDNVYLPLPTSENHRRRLRLTSVFSGFENTASKDYTIIMQVIQGGQIIGSVSEKGTLKSEAQISMLFAKLETVELEVNHVA